MKRGIGLFKDLGAFLMLGAKAHAKWEIDVSNTIMRDRKRLLLIGLLLIPIIIGGIAFADQLPDVLGGKKAYAPSYFTPTIFFASILIGL